MHLEAFAKLMETSQMQEAERSKTLEILQNSLQGVQLDGPMALELAQQIERSSGFSMEEKSKLQAILKSRIAEPSTSPSTKASERRALQDFTAMDNFLTQQVWDGLQNLTVSASGDLLMTHLWRLGLRTPSESTYGVMTALLHVCNSPQMTSFQLRGALLSVKKLWKGITMRLGKMKEASPSQHLLVLPLPDALPADIAERAWSTGPRVASRLQGDALQNMVARVPLRQASSSAGSADVEAMAPANAGNASERMLTVLLQGFQAAMAAVAGRVPGQDLHGQANLTYVQPGGAQATRAHAQPALLAGAQPSRPGVQPALPALTFDGEQGVTDPGLAVLGAHGKEEPLRRQNAFMEELEDGPDEGKQLSRLKSLAVDSQGGPGDENQSALLEDSQKKDVEKEPCEERQGNKPVKEVARELAQSLDKRVKGTPAQTVQKKPAAKRKAPEPGGSAGSAGKPKAKPKSKAAPKACAKPIAQGKGLEKKRGKEKPLAQVRLTRATTPRPRTYVTACDCSGKRRLIAEWSEATYGKDHEKLASKAQKLIVERQMGWTEARSIKAVVG